MASSRKKATGKKSSGKTTRKRSKRSSAKGRATPSRSTTRSRKKAEEAEDPEAGAVTTTATANEEQQSDERQGGEQKSEEQRAEDERQGEVDDRSEPDSEEQPEEFDEAEDAFAATLQELHELVEQLGYTVQSQWRELQETTRSLDELRSQSPRRSDVMEGRTYMSQDLRAIVEPLQDETVRLNRRLQWCFGMLTGLALIAVPALLKVLLT